MIVRRLWPGNYRVNVLVGPDAATTTIAHSFFLSADDEGTVPVACRRSPGGVGRRRANGGRAWRRPC